MTSDLLKLPGKGTEAAEEDIGGDDMPPDTAAVDIGTITAPPTLATPEQLLATPATGALLIAPILEGCCVKEQDAKVADLKVNAALSLATSEDFI